MPLRILSRVLSIVLLLSVFSLAWAQGTHEVTILKAGNGQVTLTDSGGQEHTIPVAASAKITLDGKACKLGDISANTPATVVGERINDQKTITSITARSARSK